MTWRAVAAIAVVVAAGQSSAQRVPGGGPLQLPEDAAGRLQEPALFRSGVTLVAVDAVVTDAVGNPVTGLTADDFEVREAGRPRKVATFEAVNIPIDRPTDAGVDVPEFDVATNTAPRGRMYLIALDEVSPDRTLRARNFVRRFINEYLGPNDVAAIALVGRGLADAGQDFTNKRSLLLSAINRFSGGFEPSTGNGDDKPSEGVGMVRGPAEDKAFGSDPRQIAASLRQLTEFLATLPGRKTLLYVAEGLGEPPRDIDFFRIADYRGGVLSPTDFDAHEALTAATRGNVTIYPVDPRGLTTDLTPANKGSSPILENRANLTALADVTGGVPFTNSNELGAAFERLVRDNSTYYTIGFNSEYARLDGRFVHVEVRVKRPGLRVRSRNGYVAPLAEQRRPGPIKVDARLAPVVNALVSPTSTRGVGLNVVATPYRTGRDRASIALSIEIDASSFDFMRVNGTRTAALEISYLATDSRGNVRPGRRHTANLAFKPESMDAVVKLGVRVLSQFELPHGRYQLRVAVGSAARAGSVVYDLEVPDFSRGALTMSGLSLTSTAAAAVATLRLDDPIAGALPAPPAATRNFRRGDDVTLFVEAYDNRDTRQEAAGPIELSVWLQDGRGLPIRLVAQESRAATAPRRPSGGHGFVTNLPLDVEPGSYIISVEARSGAGAPAVTRRVPIRIH